MTSTPVQGRATWHFITSEYLPQVGGVGAHTYAMATALAARGDEVHIWCRPTTEPVPENARITVHPTLGEVAPADLRATGRALDAFAPPRRLVVQWAPQGFAWRGMNLPLCLWLWKRRWSGDRIDLIVHEPFMSLEGQIQHAAVGLVQRAMAAVLLRAASDVWVTTPAWIDRLRPYSPFRMLPLRWIPVPSTVPVTSDGNQARQLRERFSEPALCLVGHFGFSGVQALHLLAAGFRAVASHPGAHLVLIGRGSEDLRADLLAHVPEGASRLHVTGELSAAEVSNWLSACDFVLQPYPDGVTTRRTTTVTALAHGVPVLTTSGPLTEAMWGESGAVALAPVDNPEGFALATRRLLKSAAERTRLKFAGRALYRVRFDIDRMIDQLREPAVSS